MHLYQAIRATFLCGLLLTSSCGVLPDSKEKADTGPTYSAKFVVPNSDAGLQLTESTLELIQYSVDPVNGTLTATGRTFQATFEAASSASQAMYAHVAGLSPLHAYLVTAAEAGTSDLLLPIGDSNLPNEALAVPVTRSPGFALLVFALVERNVTPFVPGAALDALANAYATDPEVAIDLVRKFGEGMAAKGVTLAQIYAVNLETLKATTADVAFDKVPAELWQVLVDASQIAVTSDGGFGELEDVYAAPHAFASTIPNVPEDLLAEVAMRDVASRMFAVGDVPETPDEIAQALKKFQVTNDVFANLNGGGDAIQALMQAVQTAEGALTPARLLEEALTSLPAEWQAQFFKENPDLAPSSTAAEPPGGGESTQPPPPPSGS